MCAVSAVVGGWTNPLNPNYVPWTPTNPSPDVAKQMLEVIEKLEAIDKKLNALECKVEEKEKKKFKKKLKARASKKTKAKLLTETK